MNPFKSNIWKMYLFQFLLSLHFIGGVLIPFFLDWGKITFVQTMFLQSWFTVWVFLLEGPTGAVADRFGRKISLVLSALMNTIAVFVYASKPSFSIFLIGEFLWAVSVALFSGANEALFYDSLKKVGQEKKSKKFFGRLNTFSLIGFMIGAPIGSVIATYFGLRSTMLFMTIPFVLAFILSMTFKEPLTKKKVESKRYIEILVKGIKYFYSHKILKILAFDMISIGMLTGFIIWTYQLLLKQVNVPIFYFGFVHALVTAFQILIVNNFEKFEKLFGSKKRYLVLSAIIPAISFILLGIVSSTPIVLLLILIIGAVGLSRRVLFSNYMNKYIESHNRATVISSISMVERFATAVAYPIAGLLVNLSLNYSMIFIGVGIVIFSFLSKSKESYLID